MRGTKTVLLVAMLMLVAAVPAGAQDNTIQIAVPDYIPVDGSLDIVVLTEQDLQTVRVSDCFPAGEYPKAATVIVDHSLSTAGRFTGILVASHESEPGTVARDLVYNGTCYESDGTIYKKYIGTLSHTATLGGELLQIAVPTYIPVDGSLDIMTFTDRDPAVVSTTDCFGGGAYPMGAAVLVDHSQQIAGRFTGILANRGDIGPRDIERDLAFTGYCAEGDGMTYKVYTAFN